MLYFGILSDSFVTTNHAEYLGMPMTYLDVMNFANSLWCCFNIMDVSPLKSVLKSAIFRI